MAKKKDKKKKNLKPLKWIIVIVAFIISALLVLSIHRLNIIPTKYMILGISILIIINLIADLLLFLKNKIPKVFACILYLFLIIIAIFGIHFTSITNEFLNKAFDTSIKTYSLKFYVMSPNEHKESELDNKDIYYYDNSVYVSDALKKLDEKHKANMIVTEDLSTIYNNEFFFIDEATLNMFIEEFKFDTNKYNIIYTIELSYDIKEEKQETSKNKHYYNIFVGAYDFSGSRMDLNKIVTVNTETNEILITNIHRFTYLDVPGYKQKNTLSSMSTYGFQNNINALENLFDIKLDYYIIARPDGLVTLVDDIGGIEYCSDKEFTTYHGKVIWTYDNRGAEHVHINKGCQHLDGISTLTVAREREAFYWGATERDKNTTAIMLDILEQMKKPSNIKNYTKILDDLSGMYNTSIPRDVITSSAKKLLNSGWNIKTTATKGHGGTNKIQFSNVTGAVQYPTEASINEVKAKIKALNN